MDEITIVVTGAVLGGSIAKPIAQVSCRLIEQLATESAREIGGILGDRFRELRTAVAQHVARLATEKLEQRHRLDAEIPLGFLGSALNRAADAEAPELQELWAELIANGAAAEAHRHPSLIQTLASMDAEDAQLFSAAVKRLFQHGAFLRWAINVPDDKRGSRDRLLALRLFEPYASRMTAPNPARYASQPSVEMILKDLEKELNKHRDSHQVTISGYGELFARAVGLVSTEAPHEPGSRRR